MELHLGLALPTNNSRAYYEAKSHFPFNHAAVFHNKKRSFSQLLEHAAAESSTNEDVMFPTLSLLPLTPAHPNQDDEHRSHYCSTVTKSDEDDVEALAGWPPVNYSRKKLRYDHNYGEEDEVGENDHMVWIDHQHQRRSNRLYVKVKMEGVGIARKVDLSIHHSFQTLKQTLMDMFGKSGQQQFNSYELAYQDKEGDWLLAEDVSWRSFIECAQRLKLVKSGGS